MHADLQRKQREETIGLKNRYNLLKRAASDLLEELQRLVRKRRQAFKSVSGTVDQIVANTDEMQSQRQEGYEQLNKSAKELDNIFWWLVFYITTAAVGTTVSTVGAGAALTIMSGGIATPLAAGLVAAGVAGVAGGMGAGLKYMQKKSKENAVLDETNKWIHRDRDRCEKLLKLITEYERHWQELQSNFPNEREMHMFMEQNGINAKELETCFSNVRELVRKWQRYGFGTHSEADIQRAEEVVRKFLRKEEYDRTYLMAVTLFLDLNRIGAITHGEAYLQREKPPIHMLLKMIADGILNETEPARKMARKPWRIPAY